MRWNKVSEVYMLTRWAALAFLLLTAVTLFKPCNTRADGGKHEAVSPTPGRILTPERDGNCLLLNRDGYVLTSKHVVSGSHSVLVKFCGSETGFAGVVRDTSPEFDLALIELPQFSAGGTSLHPATFADSTVNLEVGDEVSVSPADRQGQCGAGVFGRIRSVRPGEESANMLSLFSGHSGAALVGTGSGLVLGVLYASEVAWVDRPEEYLLPPFLFVPASDVRSYLDDLGIEYRAGHEESPNWLGRALVLGCAACGFMGAVEHNRANGYHDDYLAAGCGDPLEIQRLRSSVEDHDQRAAYWLGAAVVFGAAALWEYEVPQRIWRGIRGEGD